MTRIAIDHDADGAFAVITRPGQAAERVELTHQAVGRLAAAAMEAWLVEERVRRRRLSSGDEDALLSFVGSFGE